MNLSKLHRSEKPHSSSFSRLICLLLSAAFLSSCAAVVIGGAAMVATDKRSTGTVLDDQTIEVAVVDHIYSTEGFEGGDHVKVEVYQGVVLLVGEVTSDEKKIVAGNRASEIENVSRVVNELEVGESASFGERMDNTWLTTKVNTILLKENPVAGFDATRIKVVSSQNSIYLMGLVTRAEGDAVAEVARNIGGVEKVVKVFSYSD
ncbi:MAG: osmotically-inducible protein OsmY [Lysobacterales bacterium]|jgi:osmotically-inducible protein OsmY